MAACFSPSAVRLMRDGLRTAVFAIRAFFARFIVFRVGTSLPQALWFCPIHRGTDGFLVAAPRRLRFRHAVTIPHVAPHSQGDGDVQGVDYREVDDVGGHCISGLTVRIKGPEPFPEKQHGESD